jgi:hypothetical protein
MQQSRSASESHTFEVQVRWPSPPPVAIKEEENRIGTAGSVPELIEMVTELKSLISDSNKQIRALQSIVSQNEWLTGQMRRALDDYKHDKLWYDERDRKRAKP